MRSRSCRRTHGQRRERPGPDDENDGDPTPRFFAGVGVSPEWGRVAPGTTAPGLSRDPYVHSHAGRGSAGPAGRTASHETGRGRTDGRGRPRRGLLPEKTGTRIKPGHSALLRFVRGPLRPARPRESPGRPGRTGRSAGVERRCRGAGTERTSTAVVSGRFLVVQSATRRSASRQARPTRPGTDRDGRMGCPRRRSLREDRRRRASLSGRSRVDFIWTLNCSGRSATTRLSHSGE